MKKENVPLTEIQTGYREFRKAFRPMLQAAKREMSTSLQKALVDTIAATAYRAGYSAPRKPTKPLTPKGWKAGK